MSSPKGSLETTESELEIEAEALKTELQANLSEIENVESELKRILVDLSYDDQTQREELTKSKRKLLESQDRTSLHLTALRQTGDILKLRLKTTQLQLVRFEADCQGLVTDRLAIALKNREEYFNSVVDILTKEMMGIREDHRQLEIHLRESPGKLKNPIAGPVHLPTTYRRAAGIGSGKDIIPKIPIHNLQQIRDREKELQGK